MHNTKLSNAERLAQSASALGAGILGFGIGARWGFKITNYSIAIIIIGAIIHVGGMYLLQLKNKPEEQNRVAKLLWASAWICLLLVVAMFIYITLK